MLPPCSNDPVGDLHSSLARLHQAHAFAHEAKARGGAFARRAQLPPHAPPLPPTRLAFVPSRLPGSVTAAGDLDAVLDLSREGGRALRWAGPAVEAAHIHAHPPPTWSHRFATTVPVRAAFVVGGLPVLWPYNGRPPPADADAAAWFEPAWARPAADLP